MTVMALSFTLFTSVSMAQTTDNSPNSNKANTTSQSAVIASTSNSTPTNSRTMSTSTQSYNKKSDNRSSQNQDSSPVTVGVSQKITSDVKTADLLNKLLPTIQYNTKNLTKTAQKVNNAAWSEDIKLEKNNDRHINTKLQALLNWHNNGVGAIDGYWGKNTRKAMQAFQKAQGLPVTEQLNTETWQALTEDSKLMKQPVLVNYELSDQDVNIKTTTIPAGAEAKAQLEGMYYESVIEALAEKFHMSEKYLKALNPNANFRAKETITIYNPGNPNTKPVSRVVADKTTETLYAYDENNNLVASYPTTVGSTATPSPSGTHKVEVKVRNPNYTYTANDGSQSILPPGPNNPVGLVWIGLSKPSYGIHGSPDPARISRQASSGCVRLTNWDALALLGTIKDDATVEFK